MKLTSFTKDVLDNKMASNLSIYEVNDSFKSHVQPVSKDIPIHSSRLQGFKSSHDTAFTAVYLFLGSSVSRPVEGEN